jgi:predicted nucleic acid-binding Zn ribbon protein
VPSCQQCGTAIEPPKVKWCSVRCRRRSECPERHCQGCGARLSLEQRKWCSRRCKDHQAADIRFATRAAKLCTYCGEPLPTRSRRKFCSRLCFSRQWNADHRRYIDHNADRLCRWCRERLPPFPDGGMGPPRVFCDAECRKAWAGGASKRLTKAKQRGSVGGVLVDHIAVFERAGWRCQDCGCDTPRELMGKNQWTSPELDHVLSCWRGGPHVEANVQLLCRRCNLAKARLEHAEWEAEQAHPPPIEISDSFCVQTGGPLSHEFPRNWGIGAGDER